MPRPDRAIRAPQPGRPQDQAPPAALSSPGNVGPSWHYDHISTTPVTSADCETPNSAQTRLQEEQYEVTVPVILDRCHQNRVKNALEPEWEARFGTRSYGFRPGRGCHDAIAAIYNVCAGPRAQRVWALDADLAAAFDRIDHDHLLASLGSFPARDMIRGWLKAGVFEAGKGFAPTVEGTPQGGVITPPTQ